MNGWEGAFPDENLAKDGYIGVAPVDEYAPNAFGVYNAVGNVWEYVCCVGIPDAASMARRHEILISAATRRRGGSFVDDRGWEAQPRAARATRMDANADSGGHNTGFRCARDAGGRIVM